MTPTIRPYRFEQDDDAIVALFERSAAQDEALSAMSLESWRAFTGMAFSERGDGFLVAEEGDELVALATSSLYRDEEGEEELGWTQHFRVVVAPDRRRGGLGSAMLEALCQARDRRRPVVRMSSNCPGSWTAQRAFLLHHGFQAERVELQMVRPERSPQVFAPELPEGCVIRVAFEENEAIAAIHNLAYRDRPNCSPVVASGVEAMRGYPGAQFVIATRQEGDPVGFCLTIREDDGRGCIESVAVHPLAQRAGFGRALLRAGIERLEHEGWTPIALSVDAENVAALQLYLSEGFERHEATTTFTRC